MRYFLEQSILSALRAAAYAQTTRSYTTEIIVVDNASSDDSATMLRQRFAHEVVSIFNQKNVGFSAANNEGINIAKGKYILLLNPDTVLEETTLSSCVDFMEKNPQVGGLGVKMIDGRGNYLPESKRGLPSPWVSFCKLSGLGKLFPHSKRFNYYYLGHLSENENHPIEILSGAFMLMPKQVLDQVGLLDETFFMYGEDIDLSYRILQGGYQNYYFADTCIIHYKGESTKKGSLNYVRVFYTAMIIFVRKHFSGAGAGGFILVIKLGIYLHAFLTLLRRFFARWWTLALDAGLMFLGMYLLKNFWENNIKTSVHYEPRYLLVNVPLYIGIWLTSMYFSGAYDKPWKNYRLVRGILIGTLLISAMYGFLDESLRYSRAMILLGAVWSILVLSAWRMLSGLGKNSFSTSLQENRLVLVGSPTECNRVLGLLNDSGINFQCLGFFYPPEILAENNDRRFLGNYAQLSDLVEVFHIHEVIFCAADISNTLIIENMLRIGNKINYKIVPQGSESIIGSNSKNTAGDLYTLDIKPNILLPQHKRNKRVFDVGLSLSVLLTFPVQIFIQKNFLQTLKNVAKVLRGKYSWVGYVSNTTNFSRLPKLKKGIFSPEDAFAQKNLDAHTLDKINFLYAKEYSLQNDWEIVLKNWRNLGKNA